MIPPQNPDRPKVRLYLEQPLAQGQPVELSQEHAHYLGTVLRLKTGQDIAVFNGTQGEWRARIVDLGKKRATLAVIDQTLPQRDPPDLWLLFAPIKKARTDFIVEKAVELGVRRLQPVQTQFTNSERIRRDRLQAHAVEAAEQCGGTFLPQVAELSLLGRLLDAWPGDRTLWWADEGLAAQAQPLALDELRPGTAKSAILIGPEGGFSAQERARLAALPFVRAMRLGPRILRADTAAVTALTLWQSRFGDWRD
tara:strand:- start:14259 stop:15017 length:759 start_codon:yes stop_codon:yes gene_type:complete